MSILDAIKTKKQGKRFIENDDGDDRWHCSKCINLIDDYCTKQGFRPVDDIPRRCEDFRK
jgi:hypothetical protein